MQFITRGLYRTAVGQGFERGRTEESEAENQTRNRRDFILFGFIFFILLVMLAIYLTIIYLK